MLCVSTFLNPQRPLGKADPRCQTRVPERFHPGRYDVWGSSHQIFHGLILLAAMSQLLGLLTAFHHAHTSSKC